MGQLGAAKIAPVPWDPRWVPYVRNKCDFGDHMNQKSHPWSRKLKVGANMSIHDSPIESRASSAPSHVSNQFNSRMSTSELWASHPMVIRANGLGRVENYWKGKLN